MNNQNTPIISYPQAILESTEQLMHSNENVVVMGLGVTDPIGILGTTKGLQKIFGSDRVFDTPLSEDAMTGIAIGLSLAGLRPIHVHIRVDFLMLAMNQLVNIGAKMHYMFGGKVNVPLTIMTGIGAGTNSAAQHSETLYSIFTHFPGLKCVVPSNPHNAKGLMTAAIRDDDPVIVFNNRQLMGLRFDDHVPEEQYIVQIGKSDIKQEGDDITLIGIGYTTRVCMEAARELGEQGFSVEVLDLLSLSPMDNDSIVKSVQKTRKVVIVDEDYPRCSIATDISALVAEEAFDYLDAPPRRVTPPHTSVPYSRPLEALFVPNKDKVVDAALEILG